jgi:hypothetical protein
MIYGKMLFKEEVLVIRNALTSFRIGSLTVFGEYGNELP